MPIGSNLSFCPVLTATREKGQNNDSKVQICRRNSIRGIDAAIQAGIGKFGGKIPNKAALKLPLRDGDAERDDEAYANSYFVNANSPTAPQIVDRAVQPILDRSEVYSGCYAKVSINFYAFNSNGNRGIACGLGNIQKIRDGEPLGGRSSAADDFTADFDDDDDFLA